MKVSLKPLANWRDWFPGGGILMLAAAAAAGSSAAARVGNRPLSVTLALLALLAAMAGGIALIPKLLSRLRWRVVESLQLFSFTSLGMFFTFLIAALAIAALNTGNNLLFLVVSALMASYLVSGILAKAALSGLEVGYRFPDQIYAASPVRFLWLVRNQKRRFPTLSLRAETCVRSSDGEEKKISLYFPFLQADRTLAHSVDFRFARRGVYRISRINLITRFPFGFFQRGRVMRPQRELVVYPQVEPVENLLRLFPRVLGEHDERRKGQGDSIFQIRDYQSGDVVRHIHWRSSAKVARPMVRDFLQTGQDRVCICLDNTRNHEKFERAVTVAAGLASYFHGEGSRVQLLTAVASSDPERPRDGQLLEILELLARVMPGADVESFPKWAWALDRSANSDAVLKILLSPGGDEMRLPPEWRGTHTLAFDQL